MPIEVILPKVDMDMDQAKIAKWHVKPGHQVRKGQLLFEIETDKAAMEIDCPGDGIIQNITAEEGAVIAVGTRVAEIFQPGEEVVTPTISAPVRASRNTILATPLARKHAKQMGVDLGAVSGSGPRGRIIAADIEKFSVIKPLAEPVLAKPQYGVIPFDAMRRTIAHRLTLSKQTIPHFYLTATCDLTLVLELRERLNAHAPRNADKSPAWKISINDFVIKAMAQALQNVPAANVNWAEDNIHQFTSSDIGVAVAVDGGLFTPVVRDAQSKTLSQISVEMKDLAARAKLRKLLPSEYQGGTTAISNLGMFGIESFTAIINPPHASILAIGAAIERFVPINRQPVLRAQMTCNLSCDHRVVDGAIGAQLLAAFRTFIEEPALMLA